MLGVVWEILPIALGVVASPVAVLALLGIMLSDDARHNAVAYTLGWVSSVTVLLVFWAALFTALGADSPGGPHLIGRVLHVGVGLCCWAGAVFVYRRAQGMLERLAAARTPDELVAATPQLPGVLRSTEHYTLRRSYLLGAGVFGLNPTNVALVAATALNLLGSPLSATARLWVAVGFVAAAALPVLLPTLVLVILHVARQSNRVRIVQWEFDEPSGRPLESPPPATVGAGDTVVLSPYGSLFFASAQAFRDQLPTPLGRAAGAHVVIRLRGTEELGVTFLTMVRGYADELAAGGATLMLVGVNPRLADQLRATGLAERLGPENVLPAQRRLGDSLAAAFAVIDRRREPIDRDG